MPLSQVKELQKMQKTIEQDAIRENYDAKIKLFSFIETVAEKKNCFANLEGIRSARRSAQRKTHKNIGGEIDG